LQTPCLYALKYRFDRQLNLSRGRRRGQEAEAAKLAKQVGEELAQQIPSRNKLFETGK